MQITMQDNQLFVTGSSRFSARQTFTCGQCFRWTEQPDGSYLRPEPAGEPFVSQTYLHTYFAGRTVTKSAPSAPPRPQKKLPWWRRLWIWLWNN